MTNFNEAPASANVRVSSPGGFEWQFTLRAETGSKLMQMMQGFEARATAEGYKPLGRRSGGNSHQQPPATVSNGREPGSFTIDEVFYDGKSKQGDDSWRVKGGNFVQFGMLMYPEQWKASGFQAPQPGATVAAAGWTAHHNGTKIIKIEQPQTEEALTPAAVQEMTANPHKFAPRTSNGYGTMPGESEIPF